MAVPVTNPPSACVDGPEWRIWNGKTDKRPSQSRNADVSCRPKYAIPVQRFVWRLTPRTVGKAMGSGGRCRESGRTALSPLLGGGGVVAPDVDQPLWTLRSSTWRWMVSRPEIGDPSGDVYVVNFPAGLSTPSLNKRCQRRSCSLWAAWN